MGLLLDFVPLSVIGDLAEGAGTHRDCAGKESGN